MFFTEVRFSVLHEHLHSKCQRIAFDISLPFIRWKKTGLFPTRLTFTAVGSCLYDVNSNEYAGSEHFSIQQRFTVSERCGEISVNLFGFLQRQ